MIRDRDTFLVFMQSFLDKIKDYTKELFVTENDINNHNNNQESHSDIRLILLDLVSRVEALENK